MTTITIPIDVAEAAAEALGNFVSDHGWSDSDMQAMDNLDSYIARHKAIRAELAKPVEPVEPVEPAAWRTFDGEGGYMFRAYEDNEDYQEWWEKRNPHHKGWVEPLYLHPPTPAWCDAPEVAALKAELDAQLAIYDKAIDNLQSQVDELVAALKGVIRVADRKTEEFDTARAAIAKAEGDANKKGG